MTSAKGGVTSYRARDDVEIMMHDCRMIEMMRKMMNQQQQQQPGGESIQPALMTRD